MNRTHRVSAVTAIGTQWAIREPANTQMGPGCGLNGLFRGGAVLFDIRLKGDHWSRVVSLGAMAVVFLQAGLFWGAVPCIADTVTLRWEAGRGGLRPARLYRVYQRKGQEPYPKQPVYEGTALTTTIKNLGVEGQNVAYRFVVVAVACDGGVLPCVKPVESRPSNEIVVRVNKAPPPPQFTITGSYDKATDQVVIHWLDPDRTSTAYWQVYISTTGGNKKKEWTLFDKVINKGEDPLVSKGKVTVPSGSKQTFYFSIVSFTGPGQYTKSGVRAEVVIDKR